VTADVFFSHYEYFAVSLRAGFKAHLWFRAARAVPLQCLASAPVGHNGAGLVFKPTKRSTWCGLTGKGREREGKKERHIRMYKFDDDHPCLNTFRFFSYL